MVESTALEMRHTRKGIEGSNPSLSAILCPARCFGGLPHVRRATISAAAALLLSGACADTAADAAPCPPLPPAESARAEAIDAQTEAAIREAVAGRPAPGPEARAAARRGVVLACLHRSAYLLSGDRPPREAVDATMAECDRVIDRYFKAEAVDAGLSGEVPLDRAAMAVVRAEFQAAAAQRVRERQGCSPQETVSKGR